jgi:hypothetical protein
MATTLRTWSGLVVGAYELTTLVIDNWDTISAFASDPMPYLADGVKEVQEFASDTWEGAQDVASDVGDAAGCRRRLCGRLVLMSEQLTMQFSADDVTAARATLAQARDGEVGVVILTDEERTSFNGKDWLLPRELVAV